MSEYNNTRKKITLDKISQVLKDTDGFEVLPSNPNNSRILIKHNGEMFFVEIIDVYSV